jgi:hypothetical protein
MPDLSALHEDCRQLSRRLAGPANWDRLRAVYLDLAPLIGQLQGAVSEAARSGADVTEAQRFLDALKATARQVGLDIRLASPEALQIGLQTALEQAEEVLQALPR